MPQLPWYDSLDPKLAERLLRPSVQPGVIDRRLVNSIFARSQWFNSRLPLLNHLANRQSRENIEADPVPVVYVQPVLQPTDAISLTASPPSTSSLTSLPSTSSSSESSPSSLFSLPLLAPENNVSPAPLPVNQRTIVQAKFIDSTSPGQFNPTSISNPTSIFSNSTSDHLSVKQQSVSQDLTDLPLTYPPLDASPNIQQNPPLTQQPSPTIATNKPDLANTSATDLPILQIQHPQSVAISNSDLTTNRRRNQRVDRIPPLPPLHRLSNSMEASLSAETTPPVQIQRKLDRGQVNSQPVQTPQIVSEPVPLVYAQPMEQESNLSSLPNLRPDRLPAVQQVTLRPRSQSPVMHLGVESLQALTNALLVVQPSVAQPIERSDRSMIYFHTPVSSRSSDWVAPSSSPSIRAIATPHITSNSIQANSFESGQEFNQASTVANEQSANYQQTITPQQSITPQQPTIDIDTLTEKIQRKLLRQLTVESERRGHSSWR